MEWIIKNYLPKYLQELKDNVLTLHRSEGEQNTTIYIVFLYSVRSSRLQKLLETVNLF